MVAQVLERDRYTCMHCGFHPPAVIAEVAILVPTRAGGARDLSNLGVICRECGGGNLRPTPSGDEIPISPAGKQLSDAWTRRGQAADYAMLFEESHDSDIARVTDAWSKAFSVAVGDGGGVFPKETGLRNLLRRLPLEDVLEAVNLTVRKMDRPSESARGYFYGICWSTVHQREDTVRPRIIVPDTD
jgi:hypothetical protein